MNEKPEMPAPPPLHMTLLGASFGIGLMAQGLHEHLTHDANLATMQKHVNSDRVKRVFKAVAALEDAAAEFATLAMLVDPQTPPGTTGAGPDEPNPSGRN